DLTARTFERAWRSRAKYNRDLAGFSTWLFKIAQNVRIDFLQSRRGQHLPIDAALDTYSSLVRNTNVLMAVPINGVEPTRATIVGGTYPGSRTL
ncbi:MAG TPA: sigma factor, partial [Steroidobacteraceae bacterium]|nr:sigma factor [Steroidobacteraceae bacterium]